MVDNDWTLEFDFYWWNLPELGAALLSWIFGYLFGPTKNGLIILTQTYFGFKCLLAVQEMQALGSFFLFLWWRLQNYSITWDDNPLLYPNPILNFFHRFVGGRSNHGKRPQCVPGSNILGVGWHLLWPRHASRAFFLLGAVNGWFRPGQLPRSRWEHFLDVQMCMSQNYSENPWLIMLSFVKIRLSFQCFSAVFPATWEIGVGHVSLSVTPASGISLPSLKWQHFAGVPTFFSVLKVKARWNHILW